MNTKTNLGKEKIDYLTNSIIKDIQEMSDKEISGLACDVIGDEKIAAIKFDAIIENAMVSHKNLTLTVVGKKLKELSSNKNYQPARSSTNNKQDVARMVQRNKEITTFAAQKADDADQGSTTMDSDRKVQP